MTASIVYQRDRSVVITNDAGDVLVVPPGSQAEQDAAIQEHIGPQDDGAPVSLEDKVNAMAALLVDKGVATDAEMKAATAIDTVAIAEEAKPPPTEKG